MRKILLSILCLFVAITLFSCEKDSNGGRFVGSSAQTVMLDGVNIAGVWTNTESPDYISWYWEIDKTHINYFEYDRRGSMSPSFEGGYIYNNGNNWTLKMCPEYKIVGNSIFVEGLKLATITIINQNTVMMESSLLKSGKCERVKGFR